MSSPIYRQAVRARWQAAAILAAIVLVVGFLLYPVNSGPKIAVLAALLVGGGFVTIMNLRRAMKSCVCPACDTELFLLIELAQAQNTEFNHCPSCGSSAFRDQLAPAQRRSE